MLAGAGQKSGRHAEEPKVDIYSVHMHTHAVYLYMIVGWMPCHMDVEYSEYSEYIALSRIRCP